MAEAVSLGNMWTVNFSGKPVKVEVESADNGFILKAGGATHVAHTLGDLMKLLAKHLRQPTPKEKKAKKKVKKRKK